MNGIEIARRHYLSRVAPALAGVSHSAALIGPGSEVLGYDDAVSTDHDFGERVLIFRAGEVSRYFAGQLGFDPGMGVTVADWLLTPTQILASLTSGAVFHDPDGELARYRSALAWYPDDVWRYALAAAWLKVHQEEAFAARAGSTGDDLGSRILAAREARELVRLAFLVERRWAPYGKWLGRALGLRLPLADALAAEGWREREAALVEAKVILAAATNELALCPPLDTAPRQYYERDIRVIGGGRFTIALAESISDPILSALLDRVGERQGIPRIPGTVDQAVDNTDVLTNPLRFRTAEKLLGLSAG